MSIIGLLASAAQTAARGDDSVLTFHEVISDIPHDTAAFVVYGMILLSIALIWRTNRRPPRTRA